MPCTQAEESYRRGKRSTFLLCAAPSFGVIAPYEGLVGVYDNWAVGKSAARMQRLPTASGCRLSLALAVGRCM